ncbi:MAG: sugar ABC transporter ATP-binding protein, partial [Acidimicrobiales bacterium]
WLLAGSTIWLLNDPTRGVDVRARAEIHSLIARRVAEGGVAVMTSSDVRELLEVCDRLLVLARGRVVADLSPSETTEEALLAHAGGVGPAAAGTGGGPPGGGEAAPCP